MCFLSNNGVNLANNVSNANHSCCNQNRRIIVYQCNRPTPQPIIPVQPVPITANAIYANAVDATVAAGATIPLTLNLSPSASGITISNGSITLPSGYYLVSYSLTAPGPNSVSLNVNGATISTIVNGGEDAITISRTVIVNATTIPTVLTLTNSGGANLTVDEATLTAVKIA